MKLIFPNMNFVFDTESSKVNTIIIENQKYLYQILCELNGQIEGNDGRFVVSEDNKILDIRKHVELISQFVPFTLNQKSLLNRIISELEKNAISGDYYVKTMEMIGNLEQFLMDIAFDLTGDIHFSKLDIGQIIKAAGPELSMEYDSLGEKIIDYIELVTTYDRKKIFILFNLRSIMEENEVKMFMQTVLKHHFHVILIDNFEYEKMDEEYRIIIDKDLCEIL